ncbi:MAG: AAA family ATPase [Saccharofermentans sp.]|nr:AAA family ATPase [Saccharofermentans sp.]
MSIKINKLEIENVKRVKAVKIEPGKEGLTVIGGKNGQGKTSVLDSIAWALGGDKYRPADAKNADSVLPPTLKVVLSNGLIVERKGKNSDLKITDPSGQKSGQTLLDSFISKLALDLPKFMESSGKEKAKTLLQIIGVEEELEKLDREEQELYQERLVLGRDVEKKKALAAELTYYPDVPKDLMSPSELIKQQQDILAKNGENQRKRDRVEQLLHECAFAYGEVKALEQKLAEAKQKHKNLEADLKIAETDAKDLQDESTVELEANIKNIDEINVKIRANQDKERADQIAKEGQALYDDLTVKIEQIRKDKIDLLNGADLPLEGLSVKDGELTYKGFTWGDMSSSEQLRVATAIVRKLNPECGFVLIDKLEQMDIDTMNEFGKWLESEGLQAIATRVSTGDECSIIITDGYGGDVDPESVKHCAPPDTKEDWKW